jgi:hypothetical protein
MPGIFVFGITIMVAKNLADRNLAGGVFVNGFSVKIPGIENEQ